MSHGPSLPRGESIDNLAGCHDPTVLLEAMVTPAMTEMGGRRTLVINESVEELCCHRTAIDFRLDK
jgi:hypothetical protein